MLDAFEGIKEIKAQDRLIYLRWLWLVHKDKNKGMSIAEIASTLMLSEFRSHDQSEKGVRKDL